MYENQSMDEIQRIPELTGNCTIPLVTLLLSIRF